MKKTDQPMHTNLVYSVEFVAVLDSPESYTLLRTTLCIYL